MARTLIPQNMLACNVFVVMKKILNETSKLYIIEGTMINLTSVSDKDILNTSNSCFNNKWYTNIVLTTSHIR